MLIEIELFYHLTLEQKGVNWPNYQCWN